MHLPSPTTAPDKPGRVRGGRQGDCSPQETRSVVSFLPHLKAFRFELTEGFRADDETA